MIHPRLLLAPNLFFKSLFLLLASMQLTPANELAQQQQVDAAATVLESFVNDVDTTWIRENIVKARAVLIVPKLIRAGLVIGGSGGSGVLVYRDSERGDWAGPAFYSITSGSIGFQVGAQSSEVVFLIMTENGLEKLLSNSFELGADASVAAGAVGIGQSAKFTADIVSFSRSKGAFAGLAFEGAVIKSMDDWNNNYYGQEAKPTDILIRRKVFNPDAAILLSIVSKAAM